MRKFSTIFLLSLFFVFKVNSALSQIDSTLLDSGKNSTTRIFTIVENKAEFPGGYNAMIDYISANITYPKKAKKKKIEGKVYIQFIVRADGKVIETKIIKGIGAGCDEEALRVVKKMPMWKPATQKGEPVNMYFNLPISFKL